ncbi:winged helix-turn-helix transcriptional regulator [Thermodesulfobacteriota bacterium]
MRPPKINDRRLLQLIDKQGMNQSVVAKELGVSRQAINQRLKEIRGRTTRVIVAKETKAAIKQSFDAIAQLNEINQRSLDLLDQAESDPKFSLQCIAELRNQIKLAMEIQIHLFSVQEARNFMMIVKEALKEASPDAYKEFMRKINNEQSLKSALRFS